MIEIIIAFEGIIGAILGVVTTLIVTHLLNNTGHISIKITEQNLKLFVRDEVGRMKKIESLSDAEYVEYDIDIEVKNKSESRKSINDITIRLLDQEKRVIKEITPKDSDTERFSAASYHYSEMTYMNCKGKDFFKKNLKIFVSPEELMNAKYLILEYLQIDKKMFFLKNKKIEIKKG